MTTTDEKQPSTKEARIKNLRKKAEELQESCSSFERKKQPFYILLIILFLLATSLREPALAMGMLALAALALWSYKEPEQIELSRKLAEVKEKIYLAEEES